MSQKRNQILDDFRNSDRFNREFHAHNIFKNDFSVADGFSGSFTKLLDRCLFLNNIESADLGEDEVLLMSALKDIILVGSRAMFLEGVGLRKNFTLQNCLKVAGFEDESKKIDSIFHEKRFAGFISDYSFSKAVRDVVNKKIAHRDGSISDKAKLRISKIESEILSGINLSLYISYIYDAHEIYNSVVMKYAADSLSIN